MSGLDVEPAEETDEDGDHRIEVTPTESIESDDIDPGDVDSAEREEVDDEDGQRSFDGPEYVLYGGKGGVGKTTMAAATALDSARRGIRTLVVSTDPAHSLSDTFVTDVPAEPTRIKPEIPLYAAEIDPDAALEDGVAMFAGGADLGEDDGTDGHGSDSGFGSAFDGDAGSATGPEANDPGAGGLGDGPLGGMEDLLGGQSPMEALFGGAMPGADEAAAVQLLLEYLDDDRFDRVIVDTAPTGHTLRLLQLPEVMDSMVGRMLHVRQRIGGMIEGLKGMFGGEGTQEEGLENLEVLRERIERLRTVLRDPERTDFRIVMVPEEMSVFESKRLRQQLREFEIPVGTVVVNRVMEPLSDVTEALDPDTFLEPNLEDCAFCQRRWDVQQAALMEAQDLFRGTDVRRVPLLADEVRGEEMLAVVAACLRR